MCLPRDGFFEILTTALCLRVRYRRTVYLARGFSAKSFVEFNIKLILKGIGIMILVGIDVAKDKHDCFIQTSEGKVLCKTFSFANNYDGFEELYAKILACKDADIRVGLEATGHYS